jgi:hypothetical protein
MSNKEYPSERDKSRPKLKLARLHAKPTVRLTLGGFEASDDMQPSEYKVICEGASKKDLASAIRIELKFRVIEGEHTGTSLSQWITVDASGVIPPKSRYAQQCAVALGRPLDTSDNLDNPASIFFGRIFKAFVGFRKSEKPRGGKSNAENAKRRKDASDGLRVHELLAREEL